MVRTVISLDLEDKSWLDLKARKEHVSMAEIIRRAIKRYRAASESERPSFEQMLQATSGIWKGEDGLKFQERIRDEWDEDR